MFLFLLCLGQFEKYNTTFNKRERMINKDKFLVKVTLTNHPHAQVGAFLCKENVAWAENYKTEWNS